jgi:glutamate transport system permease protein
MSAREATVLYDAPGPRAIRRYRLYTVVTLVVVLLVLALIARQMQSTDQFAYEKWEYFLTPRYVETILVDGVLNTLKAAVFAILFALALGMVFGVGKLSETSWIRWPAWAFVEFFRAVPLLLLIIFIYFGYFSGKDYGSPLYALVIGLALYNGAVLAEIVRAGVLALPRGQSEAAYAIGMTRGQVTRIVLLPQAVKIMIPAMISQFVVCLKDTSLGYAIGAIGVTVVFKQIWGEARNQVQAIIVMAAIYILLNMAVTAIAHWAQRRYVGEGRGAAAAGDEVV